MPRKSSVGLSSFGQKLESSRAREKAASVRPRPPRSPCSTSPALARLPASPEAAAGDGYREGVPYTTIRLGDADVPRIGLGTNRLTNTADGRAFIRDAVAAGVLHVDTAHLYTGGASEATIGAGLSPRPASAVIATKGGYRNGDPATLRAEIEESLSRLQTDAIDLWYLHRVDPSVALEESLGVAADYRSRGVIRHIGISEVSVEEIERARAVVPIAAVQNEYSLAERKHDAVVDHCAAAAIVFVPFYPLRHVQSDTLAEIAAAHDATESQIALAWLLHRSPAMLPIPGTLSLAHLAENLRALEIALTDAEAEALVPAG